jgi:hypothetical protein
MMIEIEALATKAQPESSWVTPDRSRRNVATCRGRGVAEEMRRRLATEIEALRLPYHDDPWPWIMVVITVIIGSIIVAAIRLPEILHAFGSAATTIDHLTVLS